MMARQQKKNEPASPNFRDRANEAYEGARERAIEAYEDARERAAAARDRAGKSIGDAPLLALGGGLALGALIAAVLPKTRAEEKLLGPVGGRITDTARTAAEAAREAGREKLAELNITKDAGKGAVQSLIDGLGEAARTSGQAAVKAVREQG